MEELRLGMARVDYVQGDTRLAPNEGTTAGSKRLQRGGPNLRLAAATAYAELLALATAYLDVPAATISAADGVFSTTASRRTVTYEQLLSRASVVRQLDAGAPVLAPSQYRVVGTYVPRVDLPDKFSATFTYGHDIVLPGMLHGRVVRPSGRDAGAPKISNLACAQAPRLREGRRERRLRRCPRDHRVGGGPGGRGRHWHHRQLDAGSAVAPSRHTRRGAAQAGERLPPGGSRRSGAIPGRLHRCAGRQQRAVLHALPDARGDGASCAVADVRAAPDGATGVQATVWSGTQGVYALRGAVGRVLGWTAPTLVHVIYTEASGCYGHKGADDVAADATLLSRTAGALVRVQWTRQNEHGWEPLGAASAPDLRAVVADDGTVTAWEHHLYAATHGSRANANNAVRCSPGR